MDKLEKPGDGPLFSMFEMRPVRIGETKDDDGLYRIMDFTRVVRFFQTKKLYFAHPSKWEDPFESKVTHPDTFGLFAQCWTQGGESDAMWRIYSPNHLGVRMRTTKAKLEALVKKGLSLGCSCECRPVEYSSQAVATLTAGLTASLLRTSYNLEKAIGLMFNKREAFEHEKEWRAVIHNPEMAARSTCPEGMEIEVDPYELVESVTFDPRASQERVDAFALYFRKGLSFQGNVGKSALYTLGHQYNVPAAEHAHLGELDEPVSP